MNPLMNSVGSNAEEKLNCINAVVITHNRTPVSVQWGIKVGVLFLLRKPLFTSAFLYSLVITASAATLERSTYGLLCYSHPHL